MKEDPDVHLNASADGQARIYQAHGVQNIIQHHYHSELAAGPLDLPQLRLWVDRMINDYKERMPGTALAYGKREISIQERQLTGLDRALAERPKIRNGKEFLRQLLTSGAVQYLYRAGTLPDDPVPETMILDLAVFMLWPVVQARRLPDDWTDDLGELSSPLLVRLVEGARNARAAGHAVDVPAFTACLADKAFGLGVLGVLEDLGNPGGGGACLTAMALSCGFPPPKHRMDARTVLVWTLIASGGAAATQADDIADRVWDWARGKDSHRERNVFGLLHGDVTSGAEIDGHHAFVLALENFVDDLLH